MEEDVFKDFLSNNKKKRQNLAKTKGFDALEPWMDEPQTLPISLFTTQTSKFQEKVQKLKRHCSMDLQIKTPIVMSPIRALKPQKILPKMDIGNFNISPTKSKPLTSRSLPSLKDGLKKTRVSESTPQTVSVVRELAIQRKLYLMKTREQKQSPTRQKLRGYVQSLSYTIK